MGEYVTGEELSRSLGVSRAAVWKHVQELRKRGYSIEGSPRLGYRLTGVPDALHPWEIRRGLDTALIGSRLVHLQETESTNEIAANLAGEGYPEGTVVIAEFQRSGRGRMGRSWTCPPSKGVLMSVVFRPLLSPSAVWRLTFLSAVAVCRAIEVETGLKPGIKWPNDVLMGSRKVCGILSEMMAESDGVRHVIVGIGLNVNVSRREFPEELRDAATSLAEEGGREYSRIALARALLSELDSTYLKACEDFDEILSEWKGRCVTLGRSVSVKSPWEDVRGFAEDVDYDGALLVRLPSGDMKRVIAGDVSYYEKEADRL